MNRFQFSKPLLFRFPLSVLYGPPFSYRDACPLFSHLVSLLAVPHRSSIWRAFELDSTAAEFDSWEKSSIRRRRSSISWEESARRADLLRRASLSPGFHRRCQAGVGAE